jgi:lipoprotein-releasing system permease protein
MGFELYIARRYLLARRKQALVSVTTAISTLGVSVGVMALIIALALMTGLQREVRDRILGASPHVSVWKAGGPGIDDVDAEVERLGALPGVLSASPVLYGKALVTTSRGEAFLTVKGVDPSRDSAVAELVRAMEAGGVDGLRAPADGRDGILLGVEAARALGASVGDDVLVSTPNGTLTPFGIAPRQRLYRVAGIFQLGLFEFDSAFGFLSIDAAMRLMTRDRPDLIELRLADIYAAPDLADQIPASLGAEYIVQDWTDLNRSLFSALWIEKVAILLAIGLIVMVAALNIVASLVLLVMEKHRDIAILKTMGASGGAIQRIFMLQGLIIGLVGTTLGAAGGLGVSWFLDHYRILQLPSDVYQVSHVPFVVQRLDFAVVTAVAVLICFTATILPSRQAARLDPAQALRYQ